MLQARPRIDAPHDKLGEDVEDGLAPLSGRVLHCQQDGADLHRHSRRVSGLETRRLEAEDCRKQHCINPVRSSLEQELKVSESGA